MKSELFDIAVILFITALFSAVANVVGYQGDLLLGFKGAMILAVISFAGCVLGTLPGLKKLPTVFWVSLLAVVLSIPGVPGSEWIVAEVSKLKLMATTTPILAYAGLCIGKDLGEFKQLSWKIIPVALCVSAGTFICATIMAEIMLHLEGAI